MLNYQFNQTYISILFAISVELGVIHKALLSRLRMQKYLVPIEVVKDEFKLENSPLFEALKKTFTKDQLILILQEFIVLDVLGGVKEVYRGVKSSLNLLWWAVKNPKEAIKEGWDVIKNIPTHLINLLRAIGRMTYVDLLKCAAQVIVFGFFSYLGYSTPDLDISLFGIGKHRHFLTHSIAPGIMYSLVAKLGIRFIERIQYNYEGKSDWLGFLQSLVKTSALGYGLGVSVHLAQDLLIDGSQTIRGGPWERSTIPEFLRQNYSFDNAYLASNLFVETNMLLNRKKVA